MKELLDVCSACRYSDMKSDFPNLWCDKFIATLNGLSVKDMANLGCSLCEREIVMRKNEIKRAINVRPKKKSSKWRF